MKYESDLFGFAEKAEKEDVGGGIIRQVMGYNDKLMLCRVTFGEGSVGYTHSHPHSQLAYVESGVFEFTTGDSTAILKAGDCAYVPPGVEHGAVMVRRLGEQADIAQPFEARGPVLVEERAQLCHRVGVGAV